MLLGLWRAAVARRGFSLLHPALFPRGVVADCSTKLTRLLCRPDFVSKRDTSYCSLATFLKVMVQSSSSPAKTLGSLNRTKTCMSEGIVDVRTWDGEYLAQRNRSQRVLSATPSSSPRRPRPKNCRGKDVLRNTLAGLLRRARLTQPTRSSRAIILCTAFSTWCRDQGSA